MDFMKNTLTMILAGGRGRRMEPLCLERPKPLLSFGGGCRVIDFTLSNCINSGIGSGAIIVDYQKQLVGDYIQRWSGANNHRSTLDILEPRKSAYKGTADATYQNVDYLRKHGLETVLLLAGDHIYRMDYRKMLAFHKEMGADVTIGTTSLPTEEARRFGIVTMDHSKRVRSFVEKPENPHSKVASMGIYVFNTELLIKYLIEDSRDTHSIHDFGHVIIPRMVNNEKVFAYNFKGYWKDIGTIETYYNANMDMIRKREFGQWPIYTADNFFKLSATNPRSGIKHRIISDGCVIKGKVENSVVSPGVVVEENAEVHDSIIMAGSILHSHSIVNHCILDENVSVEEHCYIGPRPDSLLGTKEITVIGKGAIIPPYSLIYPEYIISNSAENTGFIVKAAPSIYAVAAS